MSDDTTPPDDRYESAPLRGSKKFLIVLVTVVAAALVAIGAIAVIVNDLGSREPTDHGGAGVTTSPTPASSPDETRTPEPTAGPTAGAQPGADADGERDDAPPGEPPPFQEPVDLSDTATSSAGVMAAVDTIEAVTDEAEGPGEVGGPALRMRIRLTNDAGGAINLESAVVALYHGPDRTPCVELSGPGADRFGGMLPPGATAQGVYVFTCPPEERDQVLVTVSTSPFDSTVAFAGAV